MDYSTPFLTRLGVAPDADERAVRRAYPRELKLIDQENDAHGFQALREAYEAALAWVRHEREFFAELGTAGEIEVAVPPPDETNGEANDADGIAYLPGARSGTEGTGREPPAAAPDAVMESMPIDTATPSACTVAIEAFTVHYRALMGVSDASAWERMLEMQLADTRLDSLMERRAFEHHVATLLTDGWQPGHEGLLVAAVKVFGWERDRRRVQALAPAGWVLDCALDEWGTFLTQSSSERAAQRVLIARLRDSKPLTQRELVKYMGRIDELEQYYSHWLPLITDQSAITRWRELYKKVPAWRHKLHFRPMSDGAVEKSRGQAPPTRIPPMFWAWVVFVVVFHVTKCVQSSDKAATGMPLPAILRPTK